MKSKDEKSERIRVAKTIRGEMYAELTILFLTAAIASWYAGHALFYLAFPNMPSNQHALQVMAIFNVMMVFLPGMFAALAVGCLVAGAYVILTTVIDFILLKMWEIAKHIIVRFRMTTPTVILRRRGRFFKEHREIESRREK